VPDIPDSKLKRYRQACILEEAGATDGERTAATTLRKALEAQYPGIEQAAFPPQARRARGPLEQPGSGAHPGGNAWERIFGTAARAATEWVQAAASAMDVDRLVATTAEIESAQSRRGELRIVITLNPAIRRTLSDPMSEGTLSDYADALGRAVADAARVEIPRR
jgi:hypothetical protein